VYPPPPDLEALYRSLFGSPKPGTGRKTGASPRPRPPKEEPSEDAAEVATPGPPVEEDRVVAKDKPKVILRNLAWGAAKARFNEPVSLRLEADVPATLAHLTRVEVLVQALLPDGKRETIDKKEVHLQGGKASGTVTAYYPQGRDDDGNLPATCDFVFLAKHRESDEAESPRLTVTQPLITNVRWEKAEEWFGAPVKLLATTCLKDGEEVTVKVASENGLALETKAKAKRGRLEVVWTPCLCGVAAGEDGKYPERVEYYAEISKGEERAQPGRNFFLKVVTETGYHLLSREMIWSGYWAHAEFEQRLHQGAVNVLVRKNILKGWQGVLVNLSRAGLTGTVEGCPYEGHRWAKVSGLGQIPSKYHDGSKWVPMPKRFRPREKEFQSIGFILSGDQYIQGGAPTAIWPERFKDYDFDDPVYLNKRASWKRDTENRWSRKFLIRPKPCSKGTAAGGCGYHLDLVFQMRIIETWQDNAIVLCKGMFRSNVACFSMEEPRVAMAAHEVGHYVGMPDEYKNGGIDPSINGDGAVKGIDQSTIMGQSLGIVKKRHYTNFSRIVEEQVERKIGRKLGFFPAEL
jgi:hypothetical protein